MVNKKKKNLNLSLFSQMDPQTQPYMHREFGKSTGLMGMLYAVIYLAFEQITEWLYTLLLKQIIERLYTLLFKHPKKVIG